MQNHDQYSLAKATLEMEEEKDRELQKDYIEKNDIRNPDGSVPQAIFCIEDNELFEKCNKDFSELPEARVLEKEINEARANLNAAEKAMVEFAISLAPMRIRETLRNGAVNNIAIKNKLIDMAFRLDTTTIKKPSGEDRS